MLKRKNRIKLVGRKLGMIVLWNLCNKIKKQKLIKLMNKKLKKMRLLMIKQSKTKGMLNNTDCM